MKGDGTAGEAVQQNPEVVVQRPESAEDRAERHKLHHEAKRVQHVAMAPSPLTTGTRVGTGAAAQRGAEEEAQEGAGGGQVRGVRGGQRVGRERAQHVNWADMLEGEVKAEQQKLQPVPVFSRA